MQGIKNFSRPNQFTGKLVAGLFVEENKSIFLKSLVRKSRENADPFIWHLGYGHCQLSLAIFNITALLATIKGMMRAVKKVFSK